MATAFAQGCVFGGRDGFFCVGTRGFQTRGELVRGQKRARLSRCGWQRHKFPVQVVHQPPAQYAAPEQQKAACPDAPERRLARVTPLLHPCGADNL
ncbi:hypothetical protein PATSB16_22590 [Pandoraea thiooxydans]|nr:hypothetical protein PATSB16_22590 [Pandoraea thiooxydans]